MTPDQKQAYIDALTKKLIGKAVDNVYGEMNKDQDVNFREVVGTVRDADVKITSVQYGKEPK